MDTNNDVQEVQREESPLPAAEEEQAVAATANTSDADHLDFLLDPLAFLSTDETFLTATSASVINQLIGSPIDLASTSNDSIAVNSSPNVNKRKDMEDGAGPSSNWLLDLLEDSNDVNVPPLKRLRINEDENIDSMVEEAFDEVHINKTKQQEQQAAAFPVGLLPAALLPEGDDFYNENHLLRWIAALSESQDTQEEEARQPAVEEPSTRHQEAALSLPSTSAMPTPAEAAPAQSSRRRFVKRPHTRPHMRDEDLTMPRPINMNREQLPAQHELYRGLSDPPYVIPTIVLSDSDSSNDGDCVIIPPLLMSGRVDEGASTSTGSIGNRVLSGSGLPVVTDSQSPYFDYFYELYLRARASAHPAMRNVYESSYFTIYYEHYKKTMAAAANRALLNDVLFGLTTDTESDEEANDERSKEEETPRTEDYRKNLPFYHMMDYFTPPALDGPDMEMYLYDEPTAQPAPVEAVQMVPVLQVDATASGPRSSRSPLRVDSDSDDAVQTVPEVTSRGSKTESLDEMDAPASPSSVTSEMPSEVTSTSTLSYICDSDYNLRRRTFPSPDWSVNSISSASTVTFSDDSDDDLIETLEPKVEPKSDPEMREVPVLNTPQEPKIEPKTELASSSSGPSTSSGRASAIRRDVQRVPVFIVSPERPARPAPPQCTPPSQASTSKPEPPAHRQPGRNSESAVRERRRQERLRRRLQRSRSRSARRLQAGAASASNVGRVPLNLDEDGQRTETASHSRQDSKMVGIKKPPRNE